MVGIHALDYARWAAGVDYVELSAYHANLAHSERPGCQDVAAVLARLANGGAAVFTFDYLRPAAAPTHGDDRLRVAGSRGVLEVCDQGARLSVIAADGDVPAWPLNRLGAPCSAISWLPSRGAASCWPRRGSPGHHRVGHSGGALRR